MGKTNLSKYAYHPARKEDLEINAVFYKMRDFRIFHLLMGIVWAIWGILVFSIIGATIIKGIHTHDEIIAALIIIPIAIILCFINVFIMIIVKRHFMKKDVTKELMANAKIYFPEECEGYLQRLQQDFSQGFVYARPASIYISNNHVLGKVKATTFVAIPRGCIHSIGHELIKTMFYSGGIRNNLTQVLSFNLVNGKVIQIYLGNPDHPEITVEALQKAGYQTNKTA